MADAAKLAIVFLTEMHESVELDEKDWGRRMSRHFKREWKHGGLKKTTTKVAIGAAVGIVAVSISAATGGTAIPVIAGLAVGGYAIGQISGFGLSFWGKNLKGEAKTTSFMQSFVQLSSDEQRAKMFTLQERAHKTVRRAAQHYRKAVRRCRDDLQSAHAACKANQDCDSARDLANALFSVEHHLTKASAYLAPAAVLCELLLRTYQDMAKAWDKVAKQFPGAIEQIFAGHSDDCGSLLGPCMVAEGIDVDSPYARGILANPAHSRFTHAIWPDAEIDTRSKRLRDAYDAANASAGASNPPPVTGGEKPGSKFRTRRLLGDAGMHYTSHRDSLKIKAKHRVENWWARKTTAERVGFGVGQLLTASVSVAGGAISGTVGSMPDFFDPTVELAFQTFENGMDWAIDKAVDKAGVSDDPDVDHHDGASGTGKESQEHLQKAAIHIHEIVKRYEEVTQALGSADCDSAVVLARAMFKVEHHLVKTEKYLDQAIDEVTHLGKELGKLRTRFVKAEENTYDSIHWVVAGSHEYCDPKGHCYGPRSVTDPSTPIRPKY